MRILGHGIDLVEVARIERLYADHDQHFLNRCFTPAEQAYCLDRKHPGPTFAGRFAIKEAIVKVLGTGLRGQMMWTDMEILNDPVGKPVLTLSGETAKNASAMGITSWHVSISHTKEHAMGSALGIGE